MTDSKTNTLYLADCLIKNQPVFFERFKKVLSDNSIEPKYLPNTKDIWAVDYMPIQISENKFVQFNYNPDYLQSKTQLKTISNVDEICAMIDIKPIKSNLIVDGGNIIRSKNKVIMSDKVLKENPLISEKDLIKQLKDVLEIEKLFFVPWDKSDAIGHADGMLRFIDDDTVLINNYAEEKPEYQRAFRMALNNSGLDWEELPYNPYKNKSYTSAEGIYVNYLQMQDLIIFPIFNQNEDDAAVKKMEQTFKSHKIITLKSNEVAQKGGVLNCITWNMNQ
jgi:agmatine deiminase